SIILFALITLLTPALYLLDQDPGVVPLAQPYLIILSGSIIPLMMFMTFKQFAEGLSDTKVAMLVIVGCNMVNVGLNYVLIFGKFGFQPMGLVGAGWATLIARILMVIVMWIYVR